MTPASSRSLLYDLGWHAAILVILLWPLPAILFGDPVWSVTGLNGQIIRGLAAAYVAAVTAYLVLTGRFDSPRLLTALAVAAVALAIPYLWILLLPSANYSRALIVTGTGVIGVGLLAPRVRPGLRFPLGFAALATVLLIPQLIFAARDQGAGRSTRTELVPASAYTLSAVYYAGYFPPYRALATGGAITPDPSGRGYLLVRALGELYRLRWDDGGELRVESIGLRVPINNADFAADVPRAGIEAEGFRVADLLAQSSKDGTRIFASHHFWNRKEKCFLVRVSSFTLPRDGAVSDTTSRNWQTVYETQPCLPLKRGRGTPFAGAQMGGKLVALSENRILLSVGDHQFDGWYGTPNYVEDKSTPYGKTIVLDITKGTASIFTTGNRNEQGLEVDARGRIWETEHGPQGGDELNLLREGQDYGWPNHTYGTEYGSVSWPLNEQGKGHATSVLPVYSWVPSIGISDLVAVRDSAFERWRHDLLIGSLKTHQLWRVRVEESRVVYAEPIHIGKRIRSIAAGPGEFVLWTDEETLVRITPARNLNKGAEVFALSCGSCHRRLESGIGPNLQGVVGRSVASVPGYNYSKALRTLDGKWTEARLHAFLAWPDSLAPGTTMRFGGVPDSATRTAVIDYLHSRH